MLFALVTIVRNRNWFHRTFIEPHNNGRGLFTGYKFADTRLVVASIQIVPIVGGVS